MNSKQPLVSIIIPTYNRAHLIGETLDSVLAQTYKNWECIIVDDGSTDYTQKVVGNYIEKDARFQYHHRPPEHLPGGSGARNYGFKLSSGEYIIFFDSDDLLIKTAVYGRVKNAKLYNCDLLINNSVAFKNKIGDLDILWNILYEPYSNDGLINRFLNTDMPWSTNSVTWNKDFFKKYGLWDEHLTAWQDWELHCRVLFYNPSIKYISNVNDNYFRHSNHFKIGSTYDSKNYLISLERIITKISELIYSNQNTVSNIVIKNSLKIFILRMIIKYPIQRGHKLFPMRSFINSEILKSISRFDLIKFYLIELLGKSYKIRKYIIQNEYYKFQNMLTFKSTYLKLTLKDI